MADKGDGGNCIQNPCFTRWWGCSMLTLELDSQWFFGYQKRLRRESVISVVCRNLWWCGWREGDQWGVQNMEEEHSVFVWFGDDTRSGVALADCSVASRRDPAWRKRLLSSQVRYTLSYFDFSVTVRFLMEGGRPLDTSSWGKSCQYYHCYHKLTTSNNFRFQLAVSTVKKCLEQRYSNFFCSFLFDFLCLQVHGYGYIMGY